MIIPALEADYSRLSIVDVGRVFRWQDRLFRKIEIGSEDAVRALFESGLVARLVADGLLVDTWISPLKIEGCDLLIEHALVPVPTYPREWSFAMTKDAALLVLAINEVASQFGYQTKDCNGYNVLFRQGRPLFVDLGSFVPIPPGQDTLLSYEEFLLSYAFPLKIWRAAGHVLGGRCVPRAGGALLPVEAYARFRWPVFRWFGDAKLNRWFKVMCSIRTLGHNDFSRIRKETPGWMLRSLRALKRLGWFRGPARFPRLRGMINGLRHESGSSLWSGYHDPYAGSGDIQSTARFDHVVARLCELDPASVTEIGGNQGVVSRLTKRRAPGIQVICTDPDSLAIDRGFLSAKTSAEPINWAVLNPFAAETCTLELRPESRFQSDVAVAMALTHHLTLSQGYRIDYVLDVIGSYARRFVMVEFMPLGLFDGKQGPTPPDWYREEWFSAAFCSRFDLVERIQLEANRILYVGSVRGAASARPG